MVKKKIAFVLAVFCATVLLMAVQKPVFLAYYAADAAQASVGEWLGVVWHGLTLDSTVAGYVTALPLLLILPPAVLLFRRTLREVAVAVAGLLLPALTLCYVNWAAGGEFLAQVAEPGSAFIAGTPLSLFLSTPVQNLVLPGAVFLLDLTALLFFLSDIYALGTKPRLIFIFNISALLLTAAALCGPAATPATVALAAVPSAVLLPFMFVRIHRAIALPLYLLLLASAVISAVLQ